MVNPVPGFTAKTKFHARGPSWKTCGVVKDKVDPKKKTGLHTGVDFPAPDGTTVVAARAGTTAHVDFGNAFGEHQLVVHCPDGTEDFYAHMSARVAAGLAVKAGAKVGEVGHEGNVPKGAKGSHLHFERHTKQPASWSCGITTDPTPSVNDGAAPAKAAASPAAKVRLSALTFGVSGSADVRRLQTVLNKHRQAGDPALAVSGNYLKDTDAAVRRCQQRHGFGNDAAGKSFVGPLQAAHLFGKTATIVNDL